MSLRVSAETCHSESQLRRIRSLSKSAKLTQLSRAPISNCCSIVGDREHAWREALPNPSPTGTGSRNSSPIPRSKEEQARPRHREACRSAPPLCVELHDGTGEAHHLLRIVGSTIPVSGRPGGIYCERSSRSVTRGDRGQLVGGQPQHVPHILASGSVLKEARAAAADSRGLWHAW